MRDVVVSFLNQEQLPFEEKGPLMRVPIEGENGRYFAFVRVDDALAIALVYALAPLQVPPERKAEVLELCARLNQGHPNGTLEYDVDSGELRARGSVDVEGATFNEQLFDHVFYAAVASLDQWLPAITLCVTKGQSALTSWQKTQPQKT